MAFFRKWKSYTKHKKLSEEWALATSLKDLSEAQDHDEEQENKTTFNLKYLGSTAIESEKSKNATAEAIKSVISISKTTRKKSQRVNLNVSPRGIEMIEPTTGDTLLRVSIYKISYCSADAAHDHVFAFIGSEDKNELKEKEDNVEEKLVCHVYLCPKRRIAHDVTLTVARCFENAYQIWRHSVERKMHKDNTRKSFKNQNDDSQIIEKDNESIRDLLIDFSPEIRSDLYQKDHREYLQNTWVAFDDEPRDMERLCKPSWEQQLVC